MMVRQKAAERGMWTIRKFVHVLWKKRGVTVSHMTLHRWITIGIQKGPKIRRLACSFSGRTRYLTLKQWDRFSQ